MVYNNITKSSLTYLWRRYYYRTKLLQHCRRLQLVTLRFFTLRRNHRKRESRPPWLEVQLVAYPLYLVYFFLLFLLTSNPSFCFLNAEHFGFALIDPLIEEEICEFVIFSLMLKASNDNALNKMNPVGYSINQFVLFPE